MNKLNLKKCIPCEKNVPPLTMSEATDFLKEIYGWNILDNHTKLQKEFVCIDFVSAVDFVNQVSDIAEQEGHHPDIAIHYNKVILTIWTHAINGLSENDFILAAKIDTMRI